MTALGPDSYFWLENRAIIHISVCTPLCWKVTLQAGNRIERSTLENIMKFGGKQLCLSFTSMQMSFDMENVQ